MEEFKTPDLDYAKINELGNQIRQNQNKSTVKQEGPTPRS